MSGFQQKQPHERESLSLAQGGALFYASVLVILFSFNTASAQTAVEVNATPSRTSAGPPLTASTAASWIAPYVDPAQGWRGALLVATIIPLSMLFAAILMRVFNVSGNLMSLGALDFGLIVDGAVVMVENAVRRGAEFVVPPSGGSVRQRKLPPEGGTTNDSILDACIEVGRPVVFAVIIIAIVYLPILSLTRIEGKMFKPMALTVVFALIGSLLLSLTYVPAMLTYVLRGKVSETESFVIRFAKKWYRPAFAFVQGRRRAAVIAAVALVIVSGAIFPFLGSEFIPRLDEGALAIEARLLPSVSLSQSVRTYSEVERVLRQFPEVTQVVTKIGRAEVATDPMSVDSGDVFIELKPPAEWKSAKTKEELVNKMAEALEKRVPDGASFGFSQPIELRVAELISGVRSDIAIKLFGVAVLNGVVMVSYINHLREEGKSIADAVREGAETRLRPVLMTALVASLGFIPMALATSAGAEVQRSLATVVIGGLITSTLLTPLLLPTLYGWFERDEEKDGQREEKTNKAGELSQARSDLLS